MSLIGNSINPEEDRPFFALCTMHVYDIYKLCGLVCHSYMDI